MFFQPSLSGAQGLAFYLLGDYARASRAYRAHLRAQVPATDAAPASVQDALLGGDLDQAERLARQDLERNPAAIAPHLTLGEVALERGALDRAPSSFGTALARDPNDVEALLLQSVTLARLGRDGDAITPFNRALRQGSVGGRLTLFLAMLETTGDLARRPASGRPWCLLAHYYRYLRVYGPSNARLAIRSAEAAIRGGDRPADAYLTLGIVHGKLGRRDRALAAFLAATEADPAPRRPTAGRPTRASRRSKSSSAACASRPRPAD